MTTRNTTVTLTEAQFRLVVEALTAHRQLLYAEAARHRQSGRRVACDAVWELTDESHRTQSMLSDAFNEARHAASR